MAQNSGQTQWLLDLHMVINAHEAAASQKIKKIKESVLFNRNFMSELNAMYAQIKSSYRRKIVKLKIKGLSKNGKTARVFISADTGLYGDLIQKTFDLFCRDLDAQAEIVIIGNLGRSLFEQKYRQKSFVYFDLPENIPQLEIVKKIYLYLAAFDKVMLYYGLFESLVKQSPRAVDIGGEEVPQALIASQPARIIFEPSLKKILDFFETEIFSSLLLHSLYEADLAKFAARMLVLDTAEENIRKAILQSRLEEQKEDHRETNRKQLGLVVGTHFWAREAV